MSVRHKWSSKLPKVLKRKWVAALRSGKYKQGTRMLKYTGINGTFEYCCLGVLCEVAKLETVDSSPDKVFFTHGGDVAAADVPVSFRAKIGLTTSDEWRLISLNDACGRSFKQIANLIEHNL